MNFIEMFCLQDTEVNKTKYFEKAAISSFAFDTHCTEALHVPVYVHAQESGVCSFTGMLVLALHALSNHLFLDFIQLFILNGPRILEYTYNLSTIA